MMQRSTRRLILMAMMALLTIPAFAIDIPLAYDTYSERDMSEDEPIFQPYGNAHYETLAEAPEGDWTLPDFEGERPAFALATFGDKKYLIVLDQEEGEDFFSKIYFDANANGDLTDEEAVEYTLDVHNDGQYFNIRTERMDLELTVGGTTLPYRVMLRVNYWDNEFFQPDEGGKGVTSWLGRLFGGKEKAKKQALKVDFANLRVYASVACCYRGDFEHGGKKYQLALADGNGSGRFSDTMELREQNPGSTDLYPKGDRLYLSSKEDLGYYDGVPLSQHLQLGDALFQLAVDIPSKKMTLTPITEGLGTLDLADKPEIIAVYTKDAEACVAAHQPGKTMLVPPGSYRLLNYQLQRKDEQGDLWRVVARATLNCPFVDVAAGGSAKLSFGEPYEPLVELPVWARQNLQHGNSDAHIAFNVYGAARERVTDLSNISPKQKTAIPMSEKNPERPKEPKYRIVDKAGEVVASGKFEYG